LKIELVKNTIKKYFFEGFWVLVSQFFSLVGSFFLVKLVTNLVSTEQYGKITLYISFAGLITQLVFGPVTSGIGRYFSIASSINKVNSYFKASKKLIIKLTIVLILISILSVFTINRFDSNFEINLTLLVLLYAIINAYNIGYTSISNASRNRKISAFHSIAESAFKIIFVLLFVKVQSASTLVILNAYLISSLLVYFSQVFFSKTFILERSDSFIREKEINFWEYKIWKFSEPLFLVNIFAWLQQSGDRWILNFITSKSDVGIYSILLQFGFVPIFQIISFVNALAYPLIFGLSTKNNNKHSNNKVNQITWRIILMNFITILIFYIISSLYHNEIFDFIVPEKYRVYSNLFPIVILSSGLVSASEILKIKLQAELNTKKLVLITGVTCVFSLFFSYIGTNFWGIKGLVYANLYYSSLYLILFVYMVMLKAKNKWNF
jgi:O-antigen/teichoic acid export membrane protein